jgi:Mannosylglycerate hydrolase MGH1-like glycoside hydrolase domain/Glycosyl hydrolase family 65, C-terminal domain
MKKIFLVFYLFISIRSFPQQLISGNPEINDAFKLAVETVDINVRRGVLAAGGDYGGEWTRDISINSWNGVSLLRPDVAEKSLWSVTINKDTVGHQYWDKILWAIAACNHYIVTGDKEFLVQAYKCSANTMRELEQTTFDKAYGLFMGPSVFNDGIAGYPEPIYEPGNYSSSVLDFKASKYIKCLSTNCLYYGAYIVLIQMSKFLSESSDVSNSYLQKALALKKNILRNFYDSDKNAFYYLIDQNGKTAGYQEGLGISFAVIFGIIQGDKAYELIQNAVVSKYGITSITPDFPRYSREMPGRHNNLIWPMVNGFFARAAISSKNYEIFDHEFFGLTHLALDEDKGNYNFREIYNPNSGKPDGGYQDWGESRRNFHWESCRLQTWSATAYISMVLNGLVGLRFSEDSLSFVPYLPDKINSIELKDLKYRNSNLDISIKRNSNLIESFMIDGEKQTTYSIPSTLKGEHEIIINLK